MSYGIISVVHDTVLYICDVNLYHAISHHAMLFRLHSLCYIISIGGIYVIDRNILILMTIIDLNVNISLYMCIVCH